jgi:trimethylamine--corrinoid protein Co-methyltransferase
MPSVLSKEQIEAIYEAATDILSTVGVEFEMESAREIFKKNGARVDGKRVFISPAFLEDTLKPMPKYEYEPAQTKRLVAASPFCNCPMILDDSTGQSRRGNIEDAIKMYQLAETNDLYESVNPGVVDPEGNDAEDEYLAQIAMLLKYSDKWPNLGLRATKSNTKNGDVYTSARKAIQLIREIKGQENGPVMGQGICPMAPLAYDEESLINLTVLVEEEQDVTIFPCTLSFMTGPESLMGVVIHDVAISLAGAVYVQLLKPGTAVSFTNFSTMSDMRTMQPVYASPEYLHVQIMFYEVCLQLGMNCVLCGCFADGIKNDYQGGFESCLTSIAPYLMTDAEVIWCYPGHMAAFAGGSFNKMIFDEELMINCNRVLQGLSLLIDPDLKDKLSRSIEPKSFLQIGDVSIYRKEQRITPVFDKRGIVPNNAPSESMINLNAQKIIEKRLASYSLPERSDDQKALLQQYLPTKCR